MAVPKRRTSRSNTRHRRAQWKATVADLVPVTIDGEPYDNFDAEGLTVTLPSASSMSHQQSLERRRAGGVRPTHIKNEFKVKVRLAPV